MGLIDRALGDDNVASYEGMCGEAADRILREAGDNADAHVLYIESLTGTLVPSYDEGLTWRYHQVAVVRGRVYDPWAPWRPCGIRTYLARAFPGQALTIAIDGEDVA